MRKSTFYFGVLSAAATAAAFPNAARAQSADAILDKLVEKGILTEREGRELREEADKGFTSAYQVKSGMADWVDSLKISGDFRGRVEGFYAEPDLDPTVPGATGPSSIDRTRFRYRLRLGVVATLKDSFEVGLRLGSGDIDNAAGVSSGVDPISTNQTLQNNASKKGIFIDQAYARWSPFNTADWSAALTFGKMENPFVFSDMVFDADYTPEGLAINAGFNLSESQALKFTTGLFALDEIGASSKDPFFAGAQLRLDSKWTKELSTSAGVAALGIANEQFLSNTAVPNINRGNTRATLVVDGANVAATLVNSYNPIVFDASATYTLDSFPLYPVAFPIKLGADYMVNPGAQDNNKAASVGLTFGKSGKKKTWEVGYTYKYLEGDAWYEEMVDSDFGAFYQAAPNGGGTGYQSGTNVKGHIVKFAYSPYDSITLSAKWLATELIDASPLGSDSAMNRVQIDAQWKF